MIKYIVPIKTNDSNYNLPIKIDVVYELPNKIAVLFLSPTPSEACYVGYYKWYFKNDFFNIFKYENS